MGRITVDKEENAIIFSKDRWFPEELDISESLGFTFENGVLYASLLKTSRVSLFAFLQYCFPSFVKSSAFQEERKLIYSSLKESYSQKLSPYYGKINKLPFCTKLYRHQVDAICPMISNKHNLLAFEQGLGKSITTIAVTEILRNENKGFLTLVVCPAICKWNWYNELIKWGVDKNEISVYDSKEKNTIRSSNEYYLIINYDMLKKFLGELQLRNFNHIILDEAHNIKNCKSKRHKYIAKIVKSCKAKISFLTGTPIWNKPDDLFAYLKLSKQPLGANYRKYIDRYTQSYINQWGGVQVMKGKNLFELSVKISNFMIRKIKSDCTDLPDKVYTKYYFDFLDYTEEYSEKINKIVEEESEGFDGSIHTLNIIATKSKIKNIIELIENIVYNDKKVVVFTSYNEPREMLQNHFKEHAVSVYGGMSSDKRQENIDKFMKDDSCKIFIGNMQAAGVGINLQVASDVLFCNFPLTVSELQQAIDRLHRIGQKNTVNVYYTICRSSVDESIYDMILKKSEDISKAIDNGKETIEFENAYDKLVKDAIVKWKKSSDTG